MTNRAIEINSTWSLYNDCVIVEGSKRSIIVDLTRKQSFFIPKDLAIILMKPINSIKSLIDDFGEANQDTIMSYIHFLNKNELIMEFDQEEIVHFPKINLTWDHPAVITNALIDINDQSMIDFANLFKQLETLNCQDIQIRSYSYRKLSFWEKLLKISHNTRVRSIEILTLWHNDIDVKEVDLLIQKHSRVSSFIIHSSPVQEIYKPGQNVIAFIQENIYSNLFCGNVHWNYFNINIHLFTEAQKHNTCLNRKISIDVNGEIKNCSSMAKSYGNIKDTTLSAAIEKPGFKEMWSINKDKIHVCKDCEFRFICTDCRAYIESPEDIYSKPLKCGYNPYTAEWEEWSTNPLKQKAIEYYGMQELVKKEKL